MKRKITTHSLIIAVLVGVFMLGLTQMVNARKMPPPPPLKYIVYTYCCAGGQRTGNSNDCDEGEGNCVNHHCGTGETETVSPVCP
jgi:hypothetical protein